MEILLRLIGAAPKAEHQQIDARLERQREELRRLAALDAQIDVRRRGR